MIDGVWRFLRSATWQLVLIALLWTLLNCIKPVHIDDASYLKCAREFASHPLDPYAFELNWDQWPEPAIWFTAPAVLPYWLAPAARFFYGNPFVIKLWLFPFAWLFAWGFYQLSRRFVQSHEIVLTAMTVFSAAFLPAMNLMLDVPSLALLLVAVELAFRAIDRNSALLAVAAGALAALAVETKYTTLVAPAVLLAAGYFSRRLRVGLIAGIVAVVLVIAWEGLLAMKYGQSQFVAQLAINDPRRRVGIVDTMLGLPAYFAAPVPFLFVLAAMALRVRGWMIGAMVALVSIVVLATIDPLQSVLGGGLAVLCAAVLIRIVRTTPRGSADRAILMFLIAWGAIELFAACTISPFPAVRRWYGVVIALTLILGRAAFHNRPPRLRAWPIAISCAACILIALIFYVADFEEAMVRKTSTENAAAFIRQRDPHAKISLIGHWGPEYYGERAGIMPLDPDESIVRAGDWLIMADGVHAQDVMLRSSQLEIVDRPVTPYHLRWSTARSYYGGIVPITWHRPISDEVPIPGAQPTILRVTHGGILPSAFSLDELIAAATQRGKMLPKGLLRAIERFTHSPNEAESRKATEALKRLQADDRSR